MAAITLAEYVAKDRRQERREPVLLDADAGFRRRENVFFALSLFEVGPTQLWLFHRNVALFFSSFFSLTFCLKVGVALFLVFFEVGPTKISDFSNFLDRTHQSWRCFSHF